MQKDNTVNSMRPPIVVVLGHVDHGKTTLLDKIRQSNIALKEAGGITQSIGASVITTKAGKKITFIDTPGHAVFNNMRQRGANVADIAVLVVAGDDGVKPQTKEAISFIKSANIPYLVAVTKSDLPSAQVDNVKNDLMKEEVLVEGYGGDIPIVPVSGKTGDGIDNLLEMISLIAEMNDIGGDFSNPLFATVIETVKSKKGNLVSVVVGDGHISVGDHVFVDDFETSVRGIFDSTGKSVRQVGPSDPAQILGFSDLPEVGEIVRDTKNSANPRQANVKVDNELFKGDIPLLVKANTKGSLEAIVSNLPEKIRVLYAGVGDLTESEVFQAKSMGVRVMLFESKMSNQVRKLAQAEDIRVEEFDIIYKLFERLDELVKKGEIDISGKAKILAEFVFNKQRVAGSKMLEGEILKKGKIILMRGEIQIGESRVSSLKKEKKDVDIIRSGEEFGLMMDPYLDFAIGDMVLSVRR